VRLLRTAALIAVVVGALGSIALFLRQAQRAPVLVVVGFIVWILSPFVVLSWANAVSTRWSMGARAAVYGVTLLLTLASLAVYGQVVDVAPRGAANAFRFVAVAPASWLLIAIVVPLAALVSTRRGRSG
jgi:hypothetical protein